MSNPGPSKPNKGKGRAQKVPIEIESQDPSPERPPSRLPPHGLRLKGMGGNVPAPEIAANPPGPLFRELKSLVPPSVSSADELGSPRAISMRLQLMNARALEVAVLAKNLSTVTKCLEFRPPEGLTLIEVKTILDESERLDIVMQELTEEAIRTAYVLNMAFRARFRESTAQYVDPRNLVPGDFGGDGNVGTVDPNMMDFQTDFQQLIDETLYYK